MSADLSAQRALLERTFTPLRRGMDAGHTQCRVCGRTWWIRTEHIRHGVTLELLEHAELHERQLARSTGRAPELEAGVMHQCARHPAGWYAVGDLDCERSETAP